MISKMPPRRCVVQDCERIADLELGISMHGSPQSGSVLTKWKKFVLTHRKTFSLTGKFGVCSLHFTRDCFPRAVHVEGTLRGIKRGYVPTIWKSKSISSSNRSRRQVSKYTRAFSQMLWD